MKRIPGKCLRIDWTDLEQVKKLADMCGSGNVVIKQASNKYYDITHTDRTDLYTSDEVIYTTK